MARIRSVAIVSLFVCTPLVAEAASFFSGVGDLEGGAFDSRALGISGDGSVVIGQSSSAVTLVGFRWEGGAMAPLNTFYPEAASFDGSVVVGGNGWRWENGVLAQLVVPDTYRYWTTDVSADGSVIVGSYGYTHPGNQFLWRWEGGAFADLGRPPGAESVWLPKLSGDGSVIVLYAITGGFPSTRQAYLWSNGTYTPLPTLLPDDNWGDVSDISTDGSTIVGSSGRLGGPVRPVQWVSGVVSELRLPASSPPLGWASAVSGDGSVIAGAVAGRTDGIALLWIRGEPVLMRSFLVANGLDLEGWTLTWVHGISDDGRTFTGEGINPSGGREGWIAHVAPEPGAGLLLACALLALVARQAPKGKNRPASRGDRAVHGW